MVLGWDVVVRDGGVDFSGRGITYKAVKVLTFDA